MTAHSKVGFSSMKRWQACSGSVRLSQGIESRSSVFAEEGTLAHAVGEALLEGEVVGPGEFHYSDHGVAKIATVSAEMLGHVQVYVDAVLDRWTDKYEPNLLIEQRFHLKELHPDIFGTSDAVVWQPEIRRLSVVDLKFGAGVAVEVEDNPQLLGYGLGALLENPQWKPVEVEVVIAQPRCPHSDGPVRAQIIPVVDLIDFAGDLVAAVKATELATRDYGNLAEWDAFYLYPGDHCRWCPAAATCPSLKSKAQETAKQVFAPGVPFDQKNLADTLEWLPVLEAWIKNTREFAYSEAEKGHDIPRHKLVEKRATAKWREGVAQDLAAKLGIDLSALFENAPMKGITDIKKWVPGENDTERNEFLKPFVIKESSGHTLVHESDRREAIKVDAKSAFGGA